MMGYATGVIHPLQGNWNFEQPISASFHDGNWQLHVKQSRFHLFISGERPDDLSTFQNEVISIVQGCVDALGFHLAASLRIELTSLLIDGNHLIISTNGWPALTDDLNRTKVSAQYLEPFVQAAITEPLARLALADLRSAIDTPDDTPFLSYRAVESVRQWFLPAQGEDEGSTRTASWQSMRSALGIEENSLRRLAALAKGRRHGGGKPPTGEEREESLRLSRNIVAAFVQHIHQTQSAQMNISMPIAKVSN